MRFITFFLTSLAVSVSAETHLSKGQLEQMLQMPTLHPYKTEQTQSPILKQEGVKRIQIWYGPFTLNPVDSKEKFGNSASMDPSGTSYSYLIDGFPKDITILHGNQTLVHEDGSFAGLASGIYPHHTTLVDASKQLPTVLNCTNGIKSKSTNPSVLFGGAEGKGNAYFTTPDWKVNSGYYISSQDKLTVAVDLVNYSNKTQSVYIKTDMEYVEKRVSNALDTSIQVISVGLCDGMTTLDVRPPAGQTKFTVKSKEMKFDRDGRMVAMTGHLHDGGTHIIANLNGKEFCKSDAIYGGATKLSGGMGAMGAMGAMGGMSGHGQQQDDKDKKDWESIDQMTVCMSGTKISKGDTFSLEAHYDLDKHPARQHVEGGMADEMAVMAFFFAS